jgi:hypothetical protein
MFSMEPMGRRNMTALSLESICFKKIIRNKKKPSPSTESLTGPLMKQWLNLINIVSTYRIMFTTINITDSSGIPVTKEELLERALDEAELLPPCFEKIVAAWYCSWSVVENLWTRDEPSPAGGIKITTVGYEPILFDWEEDYNYDVGGCNFTRVFYKDGKIIKETWFREEENLHPKQSPTVKQCLLSRDALSLSEDGSLIWRISKFIRGRIEQEDLIMSWTAKAFRVTY